MIYVLEKHTAVNKPDKVPADYRGRDRIMLILLLLIANIYRAFPMGQVFF